MSFNGVTANKLSLFIAMCYYFDLKRLKLKHLLTNCLYTVMHAFSEKKKHALLYIDNLLRGVLALTFSEGGRVESNLDYQKSRIKTHWITHLHIPPPEIIIPDFHDIQR